MGKRKRLKKLTTSWAGRTLSTGRMAASVGRSAVGRAVRAARDDEDLELGAVLAERMDSMKGLMMKAGQMVSYLEGTMPPEAQRVLRKLQQAGEPLAWAALVPVIEAAFDQPVSELFDTVDPDALAAASIGQVHRGVYEGQDVAIKVRYPEIAKTLEVDLSNLHRLGLLATLGTAVDRHEVVRELRERLAEECDYLQEAANQRLYAATYASDPAISIPEVVAARCREPVLTTAFVDGQRFYDFTATAGSEARAAAGATIFRFAFGSIFAHCSFNADPHPGNYLFLDDGRVCFLDFGCVRYFEPAFIAAWKALAWATLEGRRADLPEVMVATGMVPDPDRYDFDYHWEVMRYLYEPFLVPRFRYTDEYVKRSYDLLMWSNPNLRRSAMPAEWLLANRLQWGLNSVLSLLGSETDFGTVYRACLELPEAPLVKPDRLSVA